MAYKSTGTLLRIGATSIAEILSIGDVGVSNEAFESSNLSSTSKEFITTGVVDGGEISVSGFFNPNDTAGQKAMYDLVATGVLTAFSVLYASISCDFTFNAIVTSFKIGTEKDAGISFDATLRISGAPALGVTASGGLSALSMAGAGGTLSPAFGAAVRYYTYGGVTATSVTVTPTAANHTIKLFVDGVYTQDIISAQASAAISVTINVGKKLTLIAYEAGKAQQVTEIIVVKTA